MTTKQNTRLVQQLARLAEKLGDANVAIAESDTGVLTTRMSERDRYDARRYREIVQQLAGC